ncbi:UNVERIFIED_CONTAM: Beta-adaptin-like protein C [Sesamum calycinum]|uniref:Beta-adaptin-like protein C n=1 Tax=Sesamum calycinum TaxID=2727403 RepID=A0AAW2M1I4_9LAMI
MSGHDSKYFSTTKKGEIPELKEELNSQYKKDAVKKVIAAMTVGKDVSSLFTDVVNCMQTENLELKKLVYLYLINYAKSQPDLAILAVNTFVKVLLEFKEYATEVDVDFVRRAVRAIGRCAIKLERAAERCISVLLELIKIKVNYVVQEAIIVIKDIFRRYPNTYESIIATLCESLDTLDEPEAKASMIWIIGEYAERIDNADELLESFLETFPEEPSQVQLQLLTATVKLFLKKPTEGPQQMIQTWKSLPDSNEISKDFPAVVVNSVEATLDRLAASNMFFIAKRKHVNQEVLYLSAKIPRGIPFLIELTVAIGVPGLKCAVKSPSTDLAPLFFEAIETLLKGY